MEVGVWQPIQLSLEASAIAVGKIGQQGNINPYPSDGFVIQPVCSALRIVNIHKPMTAATVSGVEDTMAINAADQE